MRASTAAPVYFPPEILAWDENDPAKTFFFVDGGVTPYNNPAFQLFRMATLPQYRLNWPVGETKMMLISVGTGAAAAVSRDLNVRGQLAPANVAHLPGVLMGGAAIDQDINCRAIGRCVFGEPIDRELGDMIPRQADPLTGAVVPLEERLRPPIPLCPLQSRCKPRRPRRLGAEQRSIRITSRRWIRSNTSTRCNPSDGSMRRSSWT